MTRPEPNRTESTGTESTATAGFVANASNVAWRVLDGEAVMVHSETSAYYGLNASATYVWEAIQAQPLSLEDIARRMATHFALGPDVARNDVAAFLESLGREGLVSRTSSWTSAGAPHAAAGNGAPYEPPELARFGELEQLVLSGE